MSTFKHLYKSVTDEKHGHKLEEGLEKVRSKDPEENHLSCLLHPEERISSLKEKEVFMKEAMDDPEFTKDLKLTIDLLQNHKGPVYALVAPAYIGQFGDHITTGQIRSAFKEMGFTGMVEVAVFADILTFKEALEFHDNIKDENDFQLTSCCCPVWISLIKKHFPKIVSHIPPAVSPMIACGRVAKHLQPDAATIFIGPCMAKKMEAKEEDIKDAIDCVLTFQETEQLFEKMSIVLENQIESIRNHTSYAGRIYARTGGVSKAVEMTIKRIDPNQKIKFKAKQADGVMECKKLLEELLEGKVEANFYEGMGCQGGCVGGPKRIISTEKGKENVEEYAKEAEFETPLDNPYVIELLHVLGFKTVKDFVENSKLLTRKFT
ncbi:[Fe-Fe] hydrogenase large subunit C-terminal domain-containing protein [Anaerosacchariphilus polymeriproducens]|uniref:Hydrogenase n=1 Tax=Anaerosacchariphilus polymeriproducens TaxID=1812858 RepID=A0A371ASS4_9FIRM|nr:[Fe-Fe] hydrogenase large subunit C-terminal domain-containing protein [Anaerosacchariphilus polymeriproducens]RDU22615.1 hydrogenase [Anaerosacchariphilus polymeriproducens]